jgi:acetyl/propionyl-CoA carboxylase alpha subunit
VRTDFGVREGSRVTIYYDPMLGKLIVWGHDRAQALRRLGRALEELRVEGIHTTVPLYRALLADADFLAGRLDIEMLDRKLEAGELRPTLAAAENGETPIAVIAAAVEHMSSATSRAGVAGGDDNGAGIRRNGWREQGRRDALRSNAWNW